MGLIGQDEACNDPTCARKTVKRTRRVPFKFPLKTFISSTSVLELLTKASKLIKLLESRNLGSPVKSIRHTSDPQFLNSFAHLPSVDSETFHEPSLSTVNEMAEVIRVPLRLLRLNARRIGRIKRKHEDREHPREPFSLCSNFINKQFDRHRPFLCLACSRAPYD